MKGIIVGSIGLATLGLGFGIILSLAYKKLKVKEDPLLSKILEILPGINCGACGFASCHALANYIVEKRNIPSPGCVPGGKEVNEEITKLLGIENSSFSPKKAVLLCSQKDPDKIKNAYYQGPQSCQIAQLTTTDIACKYGCLGLGDCVKVCKFDALKIVDGLPVVDYSRCTGCGKCVEACPRNLFVLVNSSMGEIFIPACSNPEDTIETKKVCKVGCIGCGVCTKIIKDSPFYLEEKLAKLDIKKLKRQDLTSDVEKCPTKVIKKIILSPDAQR